jgi:phosphopantothenoylcysteine decarboxylase/phosphopantothenate--cysteine ligase
MQPCSVTSTVLQRHHHLTKQPPSHPPPKRVLAQKLTFQPGYLRVFPLLNMKCIVTAGPTYEDLDQVRRLTNFSTGRLGSELAAFLEERGHEVTLLLGHYATWQGRQQDASLRRFTTTENLGAQLENLASPEVDAVFHAAAVSDFTFGKVWSRKEDGTLEEVHSTKISTRHGVLLAELTPTPKLIAKLRPWFPNARIIGWKYELEGDVESVLEKARLQMADNKTDACVVNGHAYGRGFGLLPKAAPLLHCPESLALFESLEAFTKQA